MKLVTIAALVLMASVVHAQDDNRTRAEKFISEKDAALTIGSMEVGEKWWLPQQRAAVGDRELIEAAALSAFIDIRKITATNDMLILQTMQNQRIIEQNDRIIALLEKLAHGK